MAAALRNRFDLSCNHLLPFWFQLFALVIDVVPLVVVIVVSPWPHNNGEEMVSYSNTIWAPVCTVSFILACRSGNAAATAASTR